MNRDKTQVLGCALVTGSARRIGAAIASRLHQAGYDVILHCHQSTQAAHQLADTLNQVRDNSACVLVADVMHQSEIEALIQASFTWKKRLDILVNNASLFIKTPLDGFDARIWDTLWSMNVKAPFGLSAAARDYLAASPNGNIINITDIHAEKPLRDYSVYAQTKAALKMQTAALAAAYAPNIRVNAVAPGAIIAPEGKNALSAEIEAHILSKIPLKRWGEPKWVAEAVLCLASNLYMTGQTMRVNGGRI